MFLVDLQVGAHALSADEGHCSSKLHYGTFSLSFVQAPRKEDEKACLHRPRLEFHINQ